MQHDGVVPGTDDDRRDAQVLDTRGHPHAQARAGHGPALAGKPHDGTTGMADHATVGVIAANDFPAAAAYRL